MKKSIKATVVIIVTALFGMSTVQADDDDRDEREYSYEREYSRGYENPRHERHYRKFKQRKHWKRSHRAKHHFRNHHGYNNPARRHFRTYERIRRDYSGWEREYRVEKRVYQESYISPRYRSPGISINTHLHSKNALPTIAGGLIGSAIANDVSHGNADAIFGGAIFGALVGNALARH